MILKKKLKFNLIRKKNYRDRIKSAKKFSPPIDIRNWSSNPYTFLKSIYYIESSSLVVYLSQFTKERMGMILGVDNLLNMFEELCRPLMPKMFHKVRPRHLKKMDRPALEASNSNMKTTFSLCRGFSPREGRRWWWGRWR